MAPRVDGRARLPLCLAEARVTLVGSSDPWGLALQLDEGRRHGGDRGGSAAGAGTVDIAGLSGCESRTEAGDPWPVRAALLQPGSLEAPGASSPPVSLSRVVAQDFST